MSLTDTAVRNAKSGEKPAKLFDERGLFLMVTPAGGKWWRLKYRFDNKEKLLSLGVYPDVSLKAARTRRDELRALLANGIDPGVHRKVMEAAHTERAANSFEVIAREWFAKHSPNWATSHSEKIIQRLEKDIFPWIGGRPIAEVCAPEVLAVLRRIENRARLIPHIARTRIADKYFGTPWQTGAHNAIPVAICEALCRPSSKTISRQSRSPPQSAS